MGLSLKLQVAIISTDSDISIYVTVYVLQMNPKVKWLGHPHEWASAQRMARTVMNPSTKGFSRLYSVRKIYHQLSTWK